MNIINLSFGIVTVISLVATIYFGRKAIKLQKIRKRFEWSDIQSSANDLGSRIKRDRFNPDLIFTPGLKGGTFVNLLINELSKPTPVYVGISFWKAGVLEQTEISDYDIIETNKWYVSIPKSLLKQKDKKILIVDDFVMSGDFLFKLVELLVLNGFKKDNIRSVSIITTKIAIQNHKSPDYYWFESFDTDFYFPWGKAK